MTINSSKPANFISESEMSYSYQSTAHPLWESALYPPFLTAEKKGNHLNFQINGRNIKPEFQMDAKTRKKLVDKTGDTPSFIDAVCRANNTLLKNKYQPRLYNHTFTSKPCLSKEELQKLRPAIAKSGAWQYHIVRRDEFATNMNYDTDGHSYKCDIGQIRYGTLMHMAIYITSEWLSENTSHTLFDALNRVASLRREIKFIQGTNSGRIDEVGSPRYAEHPPEKMSELSFITHLGSEYKSLVSEMINQNNQKKMGSDFRLVATLPTSGKVVSLEKLVMSQSGSSALLHTYGESYCDIMRDVSVLYKNIMEKNYGSDQESLHRDLGEVFWWICRAKPWKLGDPSIAEIFVKAIALQKGMPLENPWKKEANPFEGGCISWLEQGFVPMQEGVIPWKEVIKNPDPKDFAKNFTKLFEADKTKKSIYDKNVAQQVYAISKEEFEHNNPSMLVETEVLESKNAAKYEVAKTLIATPNLS